jgi:hypothetical protein
MATVSYRTDTTISVDRFVHKLQLDSLSNEYYIVSRVELAITKVVGYKNSNRMIQMMKLSRVYGYIQWLPQFFSNAPPMRSKHHTAVSEASPRL